MMDVECDRVVIENTEVKRPARISRIQWLEFWEDIFLHLGEQEQLDLAYRWTSYNKTLDEKKKAP